jgi:hypothetical protein
MMNFTNEGEKKGAFGVRARACLFYSRENHSVDLFQSINQSSSLFMPMLLLLPKMPFLRHHRRVCLSPTRMMMMQRRRIRWQW